MLTSLLKKSTQGERTILELDLDFSVLSAPPGNPMEALKALNAPTMKALRDGLRDAAGDDSILGLLVHLGTCPLTPAQANELGSLLARFGERKPVWAFAETFGEIGNAVLPYKLAVHASQVWLLPSGQLGLGGVRAQIMLLRGVLDKVGVEPEFGQRKEYKSAAETYAAHDISDANREMTQRLADSILDDAVRVIAERRGLSQEAVREALAVGMLRPDEALARRLVDRIGYRDEVYAAARAEWSPTATPKLRYVHRYARNPSAFDLVTERTKPAIAVVGVRGTIVSGRPQRPSGGGQQVASSDLVGQELRAAGRDPQVKAVLLAVDSPGGSYSASDVIRREVLQLRDAGKPVVAVMGDVAASGGYFVSMPATEIVAAPVTLTGSIGVLAGKFVIDALKRKIGLVIKDVVAGPWADYLSPNSQFTPEAWEVLNRRLDDIYADFTAKAAQDRGMTVDQLEPLARGRVWTGADARERGLVDHLGGMDLAIDRACELAGLNRAETPVRPVSPLGFLTQFRPAESSESHAAAVRLPSPALDVDGLVRQVSEVLGFASTGVLSMPYRIRIG